MVFLLSRFLTLCLYSMADTSQWLRYQLKWLAKTYPTSGGIYISEFGFPEPVRPSQNQITLDALINIPIVRVLANGAVSTDMGRKAF